MNSSKVVEPVGKVRARSFMDALANEKSKLVRILARSRHTYSTLQGIMGAGKEKQGIQLTYITSNISIKNMKEEQGNVEGRSPASCSTNDKACKSIVACSQALTQRYRILH